MSNRIILIETSTALCSTALAENGKIVSERRCAEPRAHASVTAPFVKEMLDECGWTAGSCDAVCVGMGPGSYTGLRVGVSTAKGLCFGAGIPLLAVSTLETLFWQGKALQPEGCTAVIPMLDARRMEVYTCVYSPEGKQLTEIAPVVLDKDSFAAEFASGPVLVIGDAATKSKEVLPPSATCIQTCPEAKAMLHPAMREMEQGNFRDVAYFEPFYLKEFIATVSRKDILSNAISRRGSSPEPELR